VTRRSSSCVCALFLLGFLAGCASAPSQSTTSAPSSQPLVAVSISPQSAFVGSGQTVQFTATVTGDTDGVEWLVNGIIAGSSTTGTIDSNGNYTAPAVTQNATATITARSIGDPTESASAAASIVAPGQVTGTHNPQVALYTITPPANANVSIQFGPDMSYGLTTWTQPTPPGGGPVSIYVAGMRANTQYHMRAMLQFSGNATVDDSDHTFTTGALPAAQIPTLSVSTTAGQTPQSGVELLDLLSFTQPSKGVVVSDLAGNVLWGYLPAPGPGIGPGISPNPVKLLPDGHFLMNFSAQPDGTNSVIQEVDLSGNVVWQMNWQELNEALAAATCAGCNITVVGTHHDFAVLPNGHLIVIAAEQQVENNLTGFSGPVTVTGDVLIDLDQNHNPVWVWSEFDHLDVNRHPYMFPDWTHTNSIVYSPDDKALIVSIRHQFWVIKIDYGDGQGTGNILWKLGYQGDFALENGTDPVDWFYAQHDANVISSNSSGVFQMTMFDNGDNRILDNNGDICGTTTPCWSRIPIFQLDESAKTATIEWVDDLSPLYSNFGGNARLLANGNMEFDECAPITSNNASIYEVTKTSPPTVVWQMQIAGQYAYRGFRIPSLYPGVQW
jgi:arylsulfate sulfotransferase